MTNNKYKILIVDDQRDNLEILYRILKPTRTLVSIFEYKDALNSSYTICVAKSGQAALAKAMNDKPDLILLDIIMPDMDGFEVLSALKQCDATRNIPVIIITGLDSIQDEEKGFFLGAVDFITKPFHNSLVKARIKTHLHIVEQMHTIEMLGLIDTLTNIPNRRSFDNQISVEWGRAVREKTSISLLLIDIDNFKQLNDTYGHLQGDAVLKIVAQVIISKLMRPADIAARWGGEEFAVILPNTEINGAMAVAENIRESIKNKIIPSTNNDIQLNVTVSIGVASTVPALDHIVSDFIEQTDKALYAAKESGKNKVLHL